MVEPQLARKKSGLFRSLTAKASKVIHGADIDTQVRPQRAGTLRARARREMDGSTRQMQMQGRPRTTSESSVTIDPMTGIGSDGVVSSGPPRLSCLLSAAPACRSGSS